MAINCVEIVNWLKTWFTPKDEDYNYDLTLSNYNPTISSIITLSVYVTDGNDDPVTNHPIPIYVDGTYSSTITTDNMGAASFSYTCSHAGQVFFSASNKRTITAQVSGWKEVTLTNGKLYVNQRERICELHFSKSHNLTTANSWLWIATEAEIANYAPKTTLYAETSAREVMARVFDTGSIQANYSAVGQRSVTFNLVWHY